MADGINLTTLLSNPVNYKDGVQAGFLIFPHSDAVPTGWGEPYLAPDGSPILPGTEGGDNANRLIGIDNTTGDWAMRRSKFLQCAGVIDWKGPWKDEKTQKKRYVVSVNGPTQRYWNAGGVFVYDGNDLANEVYLDGRIIAVTPKPVLGAALSKVVTDGVTTMYIIVVCKDGEQDVAYSKKFSGYVTRENMDDKVRSAMQALQEPFAAPDGWISVGGFACGDWAVAPEAPWFFNETGTEARTMRRAMKEWTNEAGEFITEMMFHECAFFYQPEAQGGSFLLLDQNEENIFTRTEKVSRTRDMWTDPIGGVQWGGIPQTWVEDNIECTEFLTGQAKVAVDWDYKIGQWVWGWVVSKCARAELQYWTQGFGGLADGSHNGVQYPPTESGPHDHTENVWVGNGDVVTLNIGRKSDSPFVKMVVGWGQLGSKSLALSGIEDSQDHFIYFWDSLDVHLHFLDLRDYVMAGYVRYDSLLLNSDDTVTWMREKVEYGGHQIEAPYGEGKMFMRWQADGVNFTNFADLIGWFQSESLLWPDPDYEHETKVTTHDMRWTEINVDESQWKPDYRTFFATSLLTLWKHPDVENTFWRRWGPSGILYHPSRCYRDGVFGTDDKGHHMVCYRYQDVNTQEMATAQVLEPDGDIGTIVKGGDQFTPGGIV